jgi:dTDP-4-dehydrorhamnose reductase
MTKVVIVGASGFIGKRIYSYLSDKFEVYGTGYTSKDFDRVDITDEKGLEKYILAKNPDIILWLSAKKDVAFCENNPVESFEINVKGLYNLLNILKKYELKPKIIYMSADRIFDGRKGNYTENDAISPQNNYGFNKKICETILKKSNQDYKIIRISAAFGKGGVFSDWILNILNGKTKTGIFTNSYFTPTPMELICENIKEIIDNWDSIQQKVIHLSGGERMNRFEFASLISKILNIKDPPIFAESNNSPFPEDVSLIPSKVIKFRTTFLEYISEELKR